MKTITEILSQRKFKWVIIDEKGNVLEKFKSSGTARLWIPKMRLNRQEKLKVVEIKNGAI